MVRARHLLRSSVIVILFLGLGKLTGLVRARLVGNAFGTGPEYDAFTAANQLPEVFVTLISAGALAAAFIPVYSAYLHGKRAADSARLANAVLTLVIVTLGAISAVGILFAPYLVREILVPDFPAAQQEMTAAIMRIILVQTTLFGVSGVLSSVLNARQHFALPALAPIALDAGYLFGLFALVPTLGINGLAWGTVVGAVLHILIQVPALIGFRFRFRPLLDVRLPGVREVVRLMGPRVITLGAVQFADLFVIRLASGLPEGSTSGYFWGYYLMQLPETLLATAVAIVVFPTLAELYNAGDMAQLKRTAMSTMRIIWTLTIPAAAALILLGRPAIALFFQGGAFDEASTTLVYGVLVFFSLRVVSEGSLEILARLFFAQHDTRTPMLVALGWLVTNVSLAYLLVGSLGIRGLALASTIAFTLQSLVLYFLHRRRLGPLDERELLVTLGRSAAGVLAMAAIMLGLAQVWAGERSLLANVVFLTASLVGGTVAYAGTTFLLGGREIPGLLRLIRAPRTAAADLPGPPPL